MMNKEIYVSDEISDLKKVLIHRPDEGIEKVTPDSAVELLYEDIVYLEKMREEHDLFTETLRFFIGKDNVIDIQDLLADVLSDKKLVLQALLVFAQIEKLDKKSIYELSMLEPWQLAKTLISGASSSSEKRYFNPLPNLIFTRDIGTIINSHVLIAHAAKRARMRESILCRFIFYNHPLFKGNKKIDISGDGINFIKNIKHKLKPMSLEGGDVMMLNHEHLLLASSERSTPKAVSVAMELLFANKSIRKITHVELPKVRYCMHLDTILTQVNENEFVGFAPLVMEENKMNVKTFVKGKEKALRYPSLEKLFLAESPQANIIACAAGEETYQEREQWTDGCNLFMVKPGVGFAYDRNVKTNEAFKRNGYKLVKAETIVKDLKSGKRNIEIIEKTIILIPSSELSRARGGPHCLTMPLLRDSKNIFK